MGTVKSVPSLKMLPTSIPLRSFTGMPHWGHGSPSRVFARSATRFGVKSRPTFTFRRWKPSRFAAAHDCHGEADVAGHEEGRLGGMFGSDLEEAGEGRDGRGPGRGDLLEREW